MPYNTAAYTSLIRWDSGCSGPCIDAMRAKKFRGRLNIETNSIIAKGTRYIASHMFHTDRHTHIYPYPQHFKSATHSYQVLHIHNYAIATTINH